LAAIAGEPEEQRQTLTMPSASHPRGGPARSAAADLFRVSRRLMTGAAIAA